MIDHAQGDGMGFIKTCLAAAVAVLVLVTIPATASAAPRISIKVKRVVTLGQSAKLTGRLAGVTPHTGVKIELQVKPFPYTHVFKTVATRRTDSAGRFAFKVKPDRNSRYRAQVTGGSPRSKQVPLFVNGIPRTFITVKGATVHARMTFRFSRLLSTAPFSGLALRWYYKPSSSKLFRRVRTTRTHRVAAGKVGGSMTYKLPKKLSRKKFTLAWCFRPHRHGDVGIGDPRTSFRRCA
jgi:hypothetical protein